MATITHHIYSHYDPKDREELERETGQDTDDPWQTESSFSAHRRLATTPNFVPATISYSEWEREDNVGRTLAHPGNTVSQNDLAGWYRSLTAGARAVFDSSSADPILFPPPSRSSSIPQELPSAKKEKRNKNNWFIMRAIQSEPSTAPNTPPPTLADILARDPPPTSTERRYAPPVWLALGPSNRGFSMLQRSGWREGEGVGAHVHRHSLERLPVTEELETRLSSGRRTIEARPTALKQEEATSGLLDEVQELSKMEIIDLTLSDSDADDSGSEDDFNFVSCMTSQNNSSNSREPSSTEVQSPYSQKSLLTPLPTILKSDRLGIGLKAKTTGPYKESRKRVTHGAAAMAAHVKAAEELRRKKAEVGRGKRGFERTRKKEEDKRKQLLAYLNQ